MTAITFPTSPTVGQTYVATNAVTYVWTGDRWSSSQSISNNQAKYYVEGGDSSFEYNSQIDGILDGGDSQGQIATAPIVTLSLGNTELNNSYSSGYIGYTVTGAGITEVGIIQTVTTENYPANGDTLYAAAVDYCVGGNVYGSAGDTILKYPLRTGNNHLSGPDCGIDSIETSIPLDTLIQQWITAYHGYGNVDYDIYAYARTANGVYISSVINWTGYFPCLVAGTLMSLANGTQKKIEDITYDDVLSVWNFDLGELSEARPLWVKRKQTAGQYTLVKFSDGTELRTVGHHIFNKQAGEFTKIILDDTPVGTITVNEQGQEITIVSKELVKDTVDYYNIWTQYHLNAYANGVLTGNRYCNIYPVVDMKYVKDDRALRSVEEFAGIDSKYILGMRLQEQVFDLPFIQTMVDRIESLDSQAVTTA